MMDREETVLAPRLCRAETINRKRLPEPADEEPFNLIQPGSSCPACGAPVKAASKYPDPELPFTQWPAAQVAASVLPSLPNHRRTDLRPVHARRMALRLLGGMCRRAHPDMDTDCADRHRSGPSVATRQNDAAPALDRTRIQPEHRCRRRAIVHGPPFVDRRRNGGYLSLWSLYTRASSSSRAKKAWATVTSNCWPLSAHGSAGRYVADHYPVISRSRACRGTRDDHLSRPRSTGTHPVRPVSGHSGVHRPVVGAGHCWTMWLGGGVPTGPLP